MVSALAAPGKSFRKACPGFKFNYSRRRGLAGAAALRWALTSSKLAGSISRSLDVDEGDSYRAGKFSRGGEPLRVDEAGRLDALRLSAGLTTGSGSPCISACDGTARRRVEAFFVCTAERSEVDPAAGASGVSPDLGCLGP